MEREEVLARLQSIHLPDKLDVFDTEQQLLAWVELARNQVVMGYLKEITKMQISDIQTLLVLDADKKDILKAEIYGDLKRVTEIITKAEYALNQFNKSK